MGIVNAWLNAQMWINSTRSWRTQPSLRGKKWSSRWKWLTWRPVPTSTSTASRLFHRNASKWRTSVEANTSSSSTQSNSSIRAKSNADQENSSPPANWTFPRERPHRSSISKDPSRDLPANLLSSMFLIQVIYLFFASLFTHFTYLLSSCVISGLIL